MDILSNILYFLLTIFIIVLVHEFGHFAAAKLSGMRVDRFSIGFPPRAFGKKIGDTDYCISWIPIGGYVKVAGMIDESMDTEFLNKPPEPWEFRSKPLISKIFVITAGVLMNILLAILIFWGIRFFQPEILYKTTEIGIVTPNSLAEKINILKGDKIISVNNRPVEHWSQLENYIFIDQMSDDVLLEVERSGQKMNLTIPKNSISVNTPFPLNPSHIQTIIREVEQSSIAQKAGLQNGDTLVDANKIEIASSNDLIKVIQSNAGSEVSLTVKRGLQLITVPVIPDTMTKRIGIRLETAYLGPKEEVRLGIFQSFVAGVKTAYNTTIMFFSQIWHIIVGKVEFSKSIGGPVKIAQIATQSAEMGINQFLLFIGMLSLTLAIINILPFPALDGGHLVFLIYEGIFKKEFPVKAKMIIQQIGFGILLLFMAFVIYNDIFK